MLVDGMDDAACRAFSAWPERIYILGADGRIAYQGGHGPYDFHPEEARAALEAMLGGAVEVAAAASSVACLFRGSTRSTVPWWRRPASRA